MTYRRDGHSLVAVAADESEFQLTTRSTEDRLTLCMEGEVDLAAGGIVEISELLTSESPRTISVDLEKVTFVDSSGIALLINLRRRADELGLACTVINVPAVVERTLTLAGVNEFLGIAPTEN